MPTQDAQKRKEYNRRYYAKNRQAHIDRAKQRRHDCVLLVRRLRQTSPCLDCGYTYPWYVMEFDHREGEEIVARVATLANTGSKRKLLKEIEKCDLVCANCHAVRTYHRAVAKGQWRDVLDTCRVSESGSRDLVTVE